MNRWITQRNQRVLFVIVFLLSIHGISHAGIEEYPDSISVVSIVSSMDMTTQAALFYDSGTDAPKPLLVALHTWSSHYEQGGSEVTFARWCIEHDWVFIHPHFRGPNNQPKALGSDYVVADIVDAVNFARETAHIDPDRIYLIGASGGGHAALLMAGRHPEIWGGVSAWGPMFDLHQWWKEKSLEKSQYATQMESACGGKPGESNEVDRQYKIRSPKAWLKPESVPPIQIATGVHDGRVGSVPFTHVLQAFNALAASKHRLTDVEISTFYNTKSAEHLGFKPFFDRKYDRTILFRRTTAYCEVTIFEGTHEIMYSAGLSWLKKQRKGQPPFVPISLQSRFKTILRKTGFGVTSFSVLLFRRLPTAESSRQAAQ